MQEHIYIYMRKARHMTTHEKYSKHQEKTKQCMDNAGHMQKGMIRHAKGMAMHGKHKKL